MSPPQNIAIAQEFLAGLGSGRDPREIAVAFAEDVSFEIQGDEGALPWIGHQTGRRAVEDFVLGIRSLPEPVSFEVDDILSSDSRAAIVGSLQTRIKATDKTAATQFAIVLTVSENMVVRFQMLEDSFDVSNACRS